MSGSGGGGPGVREPRGAGRLVAQVIDTCAAHPWPVLLGALVLAVASFRAIRHTPVDALPDFSDRQILVATEWMGRSADRVEDQVTYPIASALLSVPGARAVRGQSMPGMSFVYVVLEDGMDVAAARARVAERVARLRERLPDDATPTLGPEASGVGWVFQYALVDDSGRLDGAKLRRIQDSTLRLALEAVPGVAEVASIGGVEPVLEVTLDPDALRAYGVDARDVGRALAASNRDVSGGTIAMAGRQLIVRSRGRLRDPAASASPTGAWPMSDMEPEHGIDLGDVIVRDLGGGRVVRVRDVAHVVTTARERRGVGDFDGLGDAVSGIVIARDGDNPRAVIGRVRARMEELAATLPPGVRIVVVYDRSTLVDRAIATLVRALGEEMLVVALVVLFFLLHVRSAIVAVLVLPLAVAAAFLPMRALGTSSNVMSLGGIAIAIGAMVDAAIVLVEGAHRRLEIVGPGANRRQHIAAAAREVGPAVFFSLLVVTVSFLPIFGLTGQSGRLFTPLALTKTFAMSAAALLSITVTPALLVLLLRGRFRPESEHPVGRRLVAAYRPFVDVALRNPRTTLLIGGLALLSAVPLVPRLGTELMPPFDEGDLLFMPTTLPGVSVDEAQRVLRAQDAALRTFPEVLSVYGKAGRADTATDPAPLEMVETVVRLRPRETWRRVPVTRWWSDVAPTWLTPALRRLWPDERPRTTRELAAELAEAARLPGYAAALTMPIRTRVDMLSTGIRSEVGVKVLGDDLGVLDATAAEVARALAGIPGTLGAVAERSGGALHVDVVPRDEALVWYGVDRADVLDFVELAVGGVRATTLLEGRTRIEVRMRFDRDRRLSLDALRALPVPVRRVGAAPVGGAMPSGTMGALDAGRWLARPTYTQAMPMGGGEATGGTHEGGRLPPIGASIPRGGSTMGTGGLDALGMGGLGMSAGGLGMSAGGMGGLVMSAGGMGSRGPRGPGAPGRADAGASIAAGLTVPLGELADVHIVEGPAMIRSEGGRLAAYVFVDVDEETRDLAGYVDEVRRVLRARVRPPAGVEIRLSGQYEELERTRERLAVLVPATVLLVLLLLYLHLRSVIEVLIVALTIPFALVGSVWALWLLDYRLSAAVAVGVVALVGLAASTGIVMVLYLDQAYLRRKAEGRIRTREDIVAAHEEGTVARIRPKVMTVATTLFGLLPLLWADGTGADVMKRIAAPMVGGLFSSLFLTLEILPVVYTYWRTWELGRERRAEARREPLRDPRGDARMPAADPGPPRATGQK